MPDALTFPEVLSEARGPGGLSTATARRAFDMIFAGEWTSAQIGGFLVALHLLGESAAVVGAAAQALRAKMVPVEHSLPLVFDTCGTGGDGQGTLNISTGAALIVAAAGVPVAKHGNRAASSRSGSADVLAALGLSLDVPATAQAQILERANIAFLFAPAHHPAMKYAGPPRRELGVRTLFNVLGPLANPARATHQLVGAYSHDVRRLMATALRDLGIRGAWVVHSEDGLDEISPAAPTHVSVVTASGIEERVVTPEDFGQKPVPLASIRGGSPDENAALLRRILGGDRHAARSALVLNASAALALARDLPLESAAELASATLDAGRALDTLRAWCEAARAAQRAAPAPS